MDIGPEEPPIIVEPLRDPFESPPALPEAPPIVEPEPVPLAPTPA